MAGFEADDLIATYAEVAKAEGYEVIIVSSDKDLMQLVDEKVSLFDPIKSRPIKREEVFEKFGVYPDKVIDVRALAGDSSDNVPGVPGIGPKTAAELITQFGNLETLLSNLAAIKQPKRRQALVHAAASLQYRSAGDPALRRAAARRDGRGAGADDCLLYTSPSPRD